MLKDRDFTELTPEQYDAYRRKVGPTEERRFNLLKNARGLKKADMLILIGVTFNNLQERKQHVYELTLPCIRGAWLQAQED